GRRGQPRAPDRPRARGAPADRRGQDEQRDRDRALREHQHRRDAPQAHHGEARSAQHGRDRPLRGAQEDRSLTAGAVKTALEKAREAPGSTKARILAAAEEVFAERGFEGASTREIAARASVNISSLHYHWESKETLYFAVFRNIYDAIVDLLRNTLAPLLSRHGKREQAIDL